MPVVKKFAQCQVPAIPEDYVPRGSPARAASRGGLDQVTASEVEPRTGKLHGTWSALQCS